jgi:hypothetical protein
MNNVYLMSREAKALEQIISNLDFRVTVVILDSLLNIEFILTQDFRLLLVSSEFVDIEKWPMSLREKKNVVVVDNSKSMDKKGRGYIKLCSMVELRGLLLEVFEKDHTYSENPEAREGNNIPKNEIASKKKSLTNEEKCNHSCDSTTSIINTVPKDNVDFITDIEIPRDFKILSSGVYSMGARNEDKTIGIWSPNSAGTTTFVVSFALFLSKIIERIGVIELPTARATHEKLLSNYGSKPDKWASFYEFYSLTSEKRQDFKWEYGGVLWYPDKSKDDVWRMEEDEDKDEFFMNNPQYIWSYYESLFYNAREHNNLVFVDIPSTLSRYTKSVIHHKVDELWVISDETNVNEMLYSEFLSSLNEDAGVQSKLIFVGDSPIARQKNRAENAANDFGIPLIAKIPNLEREIRNNISYECIPPIENNKIRKALNSVFIDLAVYLTGDKERVLSRISRSNFEFVFKKILQAIRS